jgi:very-short-patch-repair endonuclease
MENAICKWCQKPLTEKQIKKGNPTCSKSCANFYRYKDVRKEFVCQCCGKTYVKKYSGTKNGIKYCSQECARKINFGSPKSEEHKRKIGEAQHHIRIEGTFLCDRCNKTFGSNTALRAHKAHCQHEAKAVFCFKCNREFKGTAALQRHQIWCVDDYENQQTRKKMRECVSASNLRRIVNGEMKINCCDTNIERILEEMLKKNQIRYQKQFIIQDCNHCFDFYLPDYNLLLETDGDYWHGNISLFEPTSMSKKQYHTDVVYTKKAFLHGYKIIRFWGSDIEQHLDDCIKEILEYGKTGIITSNGLSRKIV